MTDAVKIEPFCWLPTKTANWLDEYDGPACGTETVIHNRPIKSDGGVPLYGQNAMDRITELQEDLVRKHEAYLIAHEQATANGDAWQAAETLLAKAMKALEPFAEQIDCIRDDAADDENPDWSPFIKIGAYRAAHALTGGQKDG